MDGYVPPSTDKYFPTSSSIYSPSTPSSFPRYQVTAQQQQPQQQQNYKSYPVSQSTTNNINYQQQQSSKSFSSYYPSQNYNSNNKQHSTSWSPQNESQSVKTSKNFNPSPLSYEKLAKFENPDPDDYYYQQPNITYRSKPKMIHNVSPTPFSTQQQRASSAGVSYPPASLSSSSIIANNNSFQPVNRQPIYHSGYQPDDIYSYGGGLNESSQPSSSRVSSVDLSQYQNYNTAPRGWTKMNDYYRPITFESKQQSLRLPYSDF